jgi:hypothetical protein
MFLQEALQLTIFKGEFYELRIDTPRPGGMTWPLGGKAPPLGRKSTRLESVFEENFRVYGVRKVWLCSRPARW